MSRKTRSVSPIDGPLTCGLGVRRGQSGSAVRRGYRALADRADARRNWADLVDFVATGSVCDARFATFVAGFDLPSSPTPAQFSRLVLAHLRLMAAEDSRRNPGAAVVEPRVDADGFVVEVAGHVFHVTAAAAKRSELSFISYLQFAERELPRQSRGTGSR